MQIPETTVVNLRTDEYDVRIDRRTKWGNPFKIGPDGTREEVIEKYREWIHADEQRDLRLQIKELVGMRLGCWCKPSACHGDVLAEAANNVARFAELILGPEDEFLAWLEEE